MSERKGIIKFIKNLINKEMIEKDNLSSTEYDIEKNINIQSIENTTQNEICKKILEDTVNDAIELDFEIEVIDNIMTNENEKNLESDELELKITSEEVKENVYEETKVTEQDYGENLRFERVNSDMSDIKIKGTNPCDITNNLTQAILKVPKHVITQEQLNNIAVTINLGHINNYQVLDVAFKYIQEIENPCGSGTISGEALLKAVVLVGNVGYSWILYDGLTKSIVYDGVQDAVTAYSVYDIIKFDQEDRPTNVTASFKTTVFEQLPEDPTVEYYLFKVEGTVDIVAV